MDNKTSPPVYQTTPPSEPFAAPEAVHSPAAHVYPSPQPIQPVHQAQQPVQYVVAQPMHVMPMAPPGSQKWTHSLMDCSPLGSCCLSSFLPCILIGKTADRMRDPSMQTADTVNTDCMLFCAIQAVTGCGWIYIMMKRSEIRERFGIEGSGTSDCCASYWCSCCALIQQDNEVVERTKHFVPLAQGYQAQPTMQMPMPQK